MQNAQVLSSEVNFTLATRKFTQSVYSRLISLQLDWGLVWLLRSPPPPALVWLGGSKGRVVAGRQQGREIGDLSAHGTGYFKPIRTFLSCFSFLPHPADSGMQRFSLQFAVFRVSHPPAPYSQSP